MKRTYRSYAVEASANKLILKIRIPQYMHVPWIPSRTLISQILVAPTEEEMLLQCDVLTYLKQHQPTRWLKYAQHKHFPIKIKVAQPSLVSNGDPLFELESEDRELLTDVAEWIVESTAAQATIMALSDIRETVRRVMTRAGEADPLIMSANSCVMSCRNSEQEFAAAIVFNQAPLTIDGILAIDSPSVYGRSSIIASSTIAQESAAEQLAKISNHDILLWMTHSEREFEHVFKNTKCTPVIPQYRDVTYIAKHINKKNACGLKSISKQYAFYAVNPFDAKQGFKNVVDVIACCPTECIAVVDFACKPLMFDAVSDNATDTTKLVDVNDVVTINHDSFTKLLAQLT